MSLLVKYTKLTVALVLLTLLCTAAEAATPTNLTTVSTTVSTSTTPTTTIHQNTTSTSSTTIPANIVSTTTITPTASTTVSTTTVQSTSTTTIHQNTTSTLSTTTIPANIVSTTTITPTASTTVSTTVPQPANASLTTVYVGKSLHTEAFNVSLVGVTTANSQNQSTAIINVYQNLTLIKQLDLLPNSGVTVSGVYASVKIYVGPMQSNYYASQSWAQMSVSSTTISPVTVSTTTILQNATGTAFNTTALYGSGFVHITQTIYNGPFSLFFMDALAPDLVNIGNSTAKFALYYNGTYEENVYVPAQSKSTIKVNGRSLTIYVGSIHASNYLEQNWAYVSLLSGTGATTTQSGNTVVSVRQNITTTTITPRNLTTGAVSQNTTSTTVGETYPVSRIPLPESTTSVPSTILVANGAANVTAPSSTSEAKGIASFFVNFYSVPISGQQNTTANAIIANTSAQTQANPGAFYKMLKFFSNLFR